MSPSWITLYPHWYARECALIARHYPKLRLDQCELAAGRLLFVGELTVHPPGGTKSHPIALQYPEATPYECPLVTPLERLPKWNDRGGIEGKLVPQLFDYRHQMSGGNLCLFQREPRLHPGGDTLDALDVLRRAERWFLGHHTGRWPRDTLESELESHFEYATDVLIEDAFYAPELTGHGRLFFVLDIRRRYHTLGADVCPMVLTAITEESGVVRTIDARANLSRVYPWIGEALWSAEKLAAARDLGAEEKAYLVHGYWWSLPREPLPFRDGPGLLKVLAEAVPGGDARKAFSDALAKEILTSPQAIVGLRYPGRDGAPEWLVLLVRFGKSPPRALVIFGEKAERNRIQKASIAAFHAHRLNENKLQLRNRGVIAENIRGKCVAMIGLGALGARVAELLGQAGVGEFCLCDHDRLVPGNVARHIGGVSDFGSRKVDVVAQRLLEINPYVRLSAENVIFASAAGSLEQLARLIHKADLVICTTADESVEAVVNQSAVIQAKTVLYGRSVRRGSMGRVFLVRPRVDACKTCLATYLEDGRKGQPVPDGWVDIPEGEEDILFHECGRPVLASSAVDLSFTANTIARVALDFLEGREMRANHWIWTRENAPGLHADLSRAMCTKSALLPPRELCPACMEPEVKRVQLDGAVMKEIVDAVQASPDRETGGVLIGYVERGIAVVVRATGPGPAATRTPTLFRRDVAHVQAALDLAAAELHDKGVYLGEWHSHLVADPEPSALDVDSLFGISSAPNYLTRCPVSVIVGLDRASGRVKGIKAWAFPVGGRMYPIELVSE